MDIWAGWGLYESQFGLGVSGFFPGCREEEGLAVRLLLLQGEDWFQGTVEEEGVVRGFGSKTGSRRDGPGIACVVMYLGARCVKEEPKGSTVW